MSNIDKRSQKELYAKVEQQAHKLRGNPREYHAVTGMCPVNVIEMQAQKILALLDELEPMALAHLNLNLLCDVYRSAYEEARHDGLVNWEAASALAEENEDLKRKLASLEAEPVEVTFAMAMDFHHALNDGGIGNDDIEEIMIGLRAAFANITAPTAPVVTETSDREMLKRLAVILSGSDAPGEIRSLTVTAQSFVDRCKLLAKERDECRMAMLRGKTEPRDDVRRDHAQWSQSTFGDVGPVGPLKHLSKEALEAAAEPNDLSEWADMQFLLWDAQRRAGITDKQITLAMIEKLAVNKARQWPEPKDGEPRLHIKPAPQQEV